MFTLEVLPTIEILTKLHAYSQDLAFSKAQLNICLCELKEKPKWKQIKFKKNSLRIKKKQHNNYFIKFNFYIDKPP